MCTSTTKTQGWLATRYLHTCVYHALVSFDVTQDHVCNEHVSRMRVCILHDSVSVVIPTASTGRAIVRLDVVLGMDRRRAPTEGSACRYMLRLV